MTDLGLKAIKAVRIELLKNSDVKYQALIDVSDESFMRLNEEFRTLWDFIETLGSIEYRLHRLDEVCIECEGKKRLKRWIDTVDYWSKECQAELDEWNKTASFSQLDEVD